MAQKLEDLINKDLLADYDDELKKTYLAGGIVFDISAHKATGSPATPATFAGLAAALGTNGANIPQNMRKGGMTVKFIKGSAQSQSNKYVQYRLTAQTFSTSEADWECIEDSVSALEAAVGTGGSVDERIAVEGARHYLKDETYTKTEVNGLVDTPHQEYVTVEHYADLPATGSADTIYRVSNWDGSADGGQGAVDVTVYSEYAWDGVSDPGRYVFLCVKSQIGEVFDISVYNNNAVYADLAAALGTNGANIPEGIRKGGMSVKFIQGTVQSSDNKYVQYRYMSPSTAIADFTNVANWQGVDNVLTANSKNLIESGAVSKEFTDMRVKSLLTPFESNVGYLVKGDVGEAAYLGSSSNMTVNKYNVIAGQTYAFSAKYGKGYNVFVITWVDTEGIIILKEYKGTSEQVDTWEDVAVTAPDSAVTMWMNVQNSQSSVTNFKEVTDELIQVQELEEKVDNNYSTLDNNINQNKTALSKKSLLTPFESNVGYFNRGEIGQAPVLASNQNTTINKYNVIAGKSYTFSAKYGIGYNMSVIFWVDSEGIIISREYEGRSEQVDTWEDVAVTAPDSAVTMWMNVQNLQSSVTNFKEVTDELIQSENLQSQIDNLRSQNGDMKVVINGIAEMATDSVPFYIRTAYNSEKDIIITHRINSNGLITFQYSYVGDKSLTDVQLMTDTNLVSSHTDSTSALRYYTQYWHLFAQHGYLVPYFPNSVGMTSADVGAEWKDQLDRRYKIGKVTDSDIWLLPVIYQDANGHYTRDWHSTSTSTAITSLTHVSGGSYTQQISVSSISQKQLRPIMEVEDRKYLIDGNIVIEPGTYYANELKVSETEIGYDPATINDWFGGIDGNPNLTGAQKHAIFTYNYNYKGAQCSVNTTIHCLREARGTYGGTQQQFFYDNGNYKAMFMIPKAAARDGIELDKPFNSPSSSSPNYNINRTSSHLKDINDPVDRQIGMLHNPTNNTYLVGMAAGLSLVKGDTVKNKRNQICLENSNLMLFSPGNTNKFYINAINTSVFESGYYPVGYFKEVDYYVSYFDPAENEGQVYWYKDGSRYVIYCHCQSVQNILSINVPKFMDGLKLSVVEKTDNAELLSDTIANGKFFVNYNTADANYIVLIAE